MHNSLNKVYCGRVAHIVTVLGLAAMAASDVQCDMDKAAKKTSEVKRRGLFVTFAENEGGETGLGSARLRRRVLEQVPEDLNSTAVALSVWVSPRSLNAHVPARLTTADAGSRRTVAKAVDRAAVYWFALKRQSARASSATACCGRVHDCQE